MSPKDPDPILRPRRYLFPTRSSMMELDKCQKSSSGSINKSSSIDVQHQMQWSDADDATMENQSLACCWKLVHSQIKWFKFDTLLCIFWWRSGPRNNRRVAKQSVPSCIDFSFSLCYVHSLTAEVTTEATWLLPVRRSLEQEGTRKEEDKRMNFDTWK